MTDAPKLLTLPKWADRVYGDDSPRLNTLRAWARDGKIKPQPVKHGRRYMVQPEAVYSGGSCDLLARILQDEQAEARQHNAA